MSKEIPYSQMELRDWLGATGYDLADLFLVARSSVYHLDGKHAPLLSTVKDISLLRQWVATANNEVKEGDIPGWELSAEQRKLLAADTVVRSRRLSRYQKELLYVQEQYHKEWTIIRRLEALSITGENRDQMRHRNAWRAMLLAKAKLRLNHVGPERARVYLSFVKRIIKNPLVVYRAEFLDGVRAAQLHLANNAEDVQAIAFHCWISSKIFGQDYYETLLKSINWKRE